MIPKIICQPAQALAFKLGQLKTRELRLKSQERLGSKFDLRQFHDTVLGHGAVPLDLPESQVNAWVMKAAEQ